MSPDKTDSHKSSCHALSNDIATVCQHTKSSMEAESHYLYRIENNLR
jgi:hypothetical protein